MFKRLKFCFKTSDYELIDYSKYIAICFDYKRIYFGIKFRTVANKVQNGEIINIETGYPEICNYKYATFHSLNLYYKNKNMNVCKWMYYTKTNFKLKVKNV